jgi:hypothetical protein
MISGRILAPKISILRKNTNFGLVPVGDSSVPHESEQSSSAWLLIKKKLDYSLAYFAAELCQSRLSR